MKNLIILCLLILLFSCNKNKNDLDVTPAPLLPSILKVEPEEGYPGLEVMIKGANFSSIFTDIKVKFNGIEAKVKSSGDSTIIVTIPEEASTGALTVTVRNQSVSWNKDFFVAKNWKMATKLPGGRRLLPYYFSVNDKAYVGGGFYSYSEQIGIKPPYYTVFHFFYYKDLYEYSSMSGVWEKKADLPANGRYNAFAFTVQQKGYIGNGQGQAGKLYKDCWQFEPASNNFVPIADFPNTSFRQFSFFEINDKAYLVSDTVSKNFWEYNTGFQKWTKRADFPGDASGKLFTFHLNSKGYVFTKNNEFWEYSPANNSWVAKKTLTGNTIIDIGFSYQGKIYIGSRAYTSGNDYRKDFWTYDLVSDSWVTLPPLTWIKNNKLNVYLLLGSEILFISSETGDCFTLKNPF